MLQLNTLRMNEKKTISWPIIGLIALIFMSVVYLAGNGQIEGHYVTSMGGVIVGYLLSFLGETVSPPQSHKTGCETDGINLSGFRKN